MVNLKAGIVMGIKEATGDLVLLEVLVGAVKATAYAFPSLTGEVREGDMVLLNTTAVDLGLGSGGHHFVISVLKEPRAESLTSSQPGHIMKLRYTPLQMSVLSAEEEASPFHSMFLEDDSLKGVPVIAGSLHSMLIPAVCGIKAVNKSIKVAYVMTDGGALPLSLSKTVRLLKERGLLAGAVTSGHAFGGDLEAVNIYSGILAARKILKADVIIVLMGPGVVGTGTKWGTTALELGQVINAAHTLEARSFTIPRLSFADPRERHRGISHHTLTALSRVALCSTCLVFPRMNVEEARIVREQLENARLFRHKVIWGEGDKGIMLAREEGLLLQSMGRGYEEDPVFFHAASAAGEAAAAWLEEEYSRQRNV